MKFALCSVQTGTEGLGYLRRGSIMGKSLKSSPDGGCGSERVMANHPRILSADPHCLVRVRLPEPGQTSPPRGAGCAGSPSQSASRAAEKIAPLRLLLGNNDGFLSRSGSCNTVCDRPV